MLATSNAVAQQGFGTNKPNKASAVEIKSNNKGLLIPRINIEALNSSAPIMVAQGDMPKSLLVYNTNTTIGEGFYYWNGSKWEPFTTGSTDLNTKNALLKVVGTELVLTDSDGGEVKVLLTDIDKQQIQTFEIGTDHKLTIELENGGGTKNVDLTPYFNSTILKAGTNTTLDGTGITTDPYKVNVATATKTNLGVVKIGNNINVAADGTISVDDAAADIETTMTETVTGHKIGVYTNELKVPVTINETVTTVTDTKTTGNKIATYTNEAGTPVVINETITSLTQDVDGIHYQPETGNAQDAKVVSANAGNLIKTGTDFGALLTEADVQGAQKTYEVKSSDSSVAISTADSAGNHTVYNLSVTGVNAGIAVGNGISKDTDTNKTVILGGTLTKEATDIKTDADHTLAISGLQEATEKLDEKVVKNKVVVVEDATGILRTVERVVTGTNVNVASNTGYSFFAPEVVINVTLGNTDQAITFPSASDAKGQTISIKIANTTDTHTGYLNLLDTYGSMPYQGWIVKSNGTDWVIVGRN